MKMKSRRELLKRITAKSFESMSLSPSATNTAIQKNVGMIYSSELNGQRATRRKFVIGGLIATVGVAGLLADFLYGGPIRNALYPQNTTRGQEMTGLTELLTKSSSEVTSTSSNTFAYTGRLFFDRGTSTFGTAGDGIQSDSDLEQGEQNAKVIFLDANSKPAGTATTDSSGDFSIDLPKGNYTIYPMISNPSRTYGYMCQSLDEFRAVSDGYEITVGENNPKASIGLMEGWLSHPLRDVDTRGYYYDRNPSPDDYLAWNGDTCCSEDSNNPGSHFQAQWGDDVAAPAPGYVAGILSNLPENWVFMVVQPTQNSPRYNIAFAHNSKVLAKVGQQVSRYQPIAKVGTNGCRGCNGVPVLHLQITEVNKQDGSVLFLDPYEPVFPYNKDNSGGAWSNNKDGTDFHWQPLAQNQNPNWKNYWIVRNQVHYGPPYI